MPAPSPVSSQEVTHVKPSAFTYDVNASRIVQARSSSAASPICLPMTGLGDGLGLSDSHAASGRRTVEVSRGVAAATAGPEVESGGGGTGGGGGGSPTTTAYGSKQYYAATAWSNGTGTSAGAAGGGGVYDEDVTVDYAICSPSFATVTDEASPYRVTSHPTTTTAARASGLMYMDADTTYGYGPVRPPAETGCLPYHHPSLAGAVTRPERLPGRAGATAPYRATDYRRSGDGLNGTGFHSYAASAAHLAFGGPETAGYALSDATAAFGGPGPMTAAATTTTTTTDGDHHGQSFLFRPHDGCGSLQGEAEKGPEEGKSSARMRR
ncbi:fungal zn(2)-Cys(6) binuclear cluster domain-containing protein [Ophiocordyceps camponoti-floridani]|uniref:Fungal zn(2)-Cys(6) binuclear cluster domain-containing protein n=1 Tax=Ophiocordyceps camponoti-floridani TaxID=2030778 RepID=A0A8H4Q222_9HYPO|nr:fungal zn(2)-Cys(6) binuclear cluster domain-containing protein [Ophiocordyceps camponoti-floridani]